MRAPRVFSPRWECRQINALFVSFTPRTRVSIAIIEGVTLSLSLSSLPSFFLSFSLSSEEEEEEEAVKQVSLCFHDKSVNSAVYPARNFNLGYDKGINFVRGRRLVGYYSGSSLSHVTQQWYSSYSGNDYENARVDLAPQETPPKRSNYNSTYTQTFLLPSTVYIYI